MPKGKDHAKLISFLMAAEFCYCGCVKRLLTFLLPGDGVPLLLSVVRKMIEAVQEPSRDTNAKLLQQLIDNAGANFRSFGCVCSRPTAGFVYSSLQRGTFS